MKQIILILIVFLSLDVCADSIKGITEDGKSVLLNSNGTWKYLKESGDQSVFNFRKTYWGMSKNQVKTTEKGKIIRDDNVLAYKGQLAGLQTVVAYFFVKDRLVRSRYIFIEPHTNKNDYLHDYEKIQSILKSKYNEPKSDDTYWRNNLYKKDYEDWGTAISIGHLSKYTVWKSNDTKITLNLSGDNYKILHLVEYKSTKLENLEKASIEAKEADQF